MFYVALTIFCFCHIFVNSLLSYVSMVRENFLAYEKLKSMLDKNENDCKSSLYLLSYAEDVMSGRACLHSSALGQNKTEKMSQRWRAVGNTMSNLTGPGIEP